MNGHIEPWIDRYLDGELTVKQVDQVERHLDACEDCARLVAAQRDLSNLLREAPGAQGLKPEKQFVAEVGLQLGRRPDAIRPMRRILNWGWQIIPLGLFLVYVFVQTVFILSDILGFIPGVEVALPARTTLLPAWLAFPQPLGEMLRIIERFNLPHWDWSSGLIILAGVSLLYAAWLVSWWLVTRPEMEKLNH